MSWFLAAMIKHQLGRKRVLDTLLAGTFRTVLANPDQVAVSHLYPPDNVGSTLTVQVENDETLLDSNAQIVSLDDRIPGRPYVSSNPVGITAGGDADVIINGENLDGTTYLSFNGIPHLHFSNIVVVSSNRVNVHVHAEADTPITGDEATNLTITTPAGESNAFEFIVNRP